MTNIMIVTGAFGLMWLLELLGPGRAWPKRRLWILRAILVNAGQALVVILGAMTWDQALPGLSLWYIGTENVIAGAFAGYLLITFIFYWWHRARHEIPLLWRLLHQLHHSPQRLEVFTTFYKHPLEILLNGLLSSAILHVLLGLSPAQASVAILMTGLAELFYHWNVRTPYWLGFFVQRPESHCVHHARGSHTSNFSDLPLWDWMFGTFRNPREHEFACGFADNQEYAMGRMLIGLSPLKRTPEDRQ
jgi:sterol desaturase/sphingolipid hydroxylase (fatty acid hydroxylase superfamily)